MERSSWEYLSTLTWSVSRLSISASQSQALGSVQKDSGYQRWARVPGQTDLQWEPEMEWPSGPLPASGTQPPSANALFPLLHSPLFFPFHGFFQCPCVLPETVLMLPIWRSPTSEGWDLKRSHPCPVFLLVICRSSSQGGGKPFLRSALHTPPCGSSRFSCAAPSTICSHYLLAKTWQGNACCFPF